MKIKLTIGIVALTLAALMAVGYLEEERGNTLKIGREFKDVDVSKAECPNLIHKIESAQSVSKVGRCSIVRSEDREAVVVWLAASEPIFDDQAKRKEWLVEAAIASAETISAPTSSIKLTDQKSAKEEKWLSLFRIGEAWLEGSGKNAKQRVLEQDTITPVLAEMDKINNARLLGKKESKEGLYEILNKSFSVVTLKEEGLKVDLQFKQASR